MIFNWEKKYIEPLNRSLNRYIYTYIANTVANAEMERELQLWACAPLVSGLITGVNEGMEAEPCLSDVLSLWALQLCWD